MRHSGSAAGAHCCLHLPTYPTVPARTCPPACSVLPPQDECRQRGIPYARYATLPEILGRFCRYMKEVGAAEQVPMSKHVGDLARV